MKKIRLAPILVIQFAPARTRYWTPSACLGAWKQHTNTHSNQQIVSNAHTDQVDPTAHRHTRPADTDPHKCRRSASPAARFPRERGTGDRALRHLLVGG
jgi:hypothetical protein